MPNDRFKRYVEKPIKDIDAAELKSDLIELDQEIGEAEAALAELKDDRERISGLASVVAYLSHDDTSANGSGPGDPARSRRLTKREAVLALLADDRTWSTDAIHAALVEQGVSEKSAYSSLLSTLSHMYSNRELERPRQGSYRLPSETTAEHLTREAVEAPNAERTG
jgi:hypothetical protein